MINLILNSIASTDWGMGRVLYTQSLPSSKVTFSIGFWERYMSFVRISLQITETWWLRTENGSLTFMDPGVQSQETLVD